MCNLQGSFIPFAATKAERIAAGDPRLSIEERYPSKEVYLAAFKRAADDLVAKRFLLPDDAALLVSSRGERGYPERALAPSGASSAYRVAASNASQSRCASQ